MCDLEVSFISWFAKGFNGGYFGIFQHCLKFDNNNGVGIFVLSKLIIHVTMKFDLNLLSHIFIGFEMGHL